MPSAFLTASQRCTCARRLIVSAGPTGDAFVTVLVRLSATIRVRPFTDTPEPFMGPVVSVAAATQVLAAHATLLARGGTTVVPTVSLRPYTGLLAPGVIDVTAVRERADEEMFSPLLQLIRVPDFAAALGEADATRYGLAGGLIADALALYARFRDEVRAGLINWSQRLTGASVGGQSGNHRPAAFFAADYGAYLVASIEVPELKLPVTLPSGLSALEPHAKIAMVAKSNPLPFALCATFA